MATMTGSAHALRCVWACVLLATISAAGPAPAAAHRNDVRVGIGDQGIAMFDHPAFRRAEVRQVRYFLRWNAIHYRDDRLRARRWVEKAIDEGKRPFIHLSTEDLREDEGLLPKSDHYGRDVKRLVRYFRRFGVRDFGVWNEANHASQPTHESPWKAGRYFREMYRAVFDTCTRRSCRVVALDVLDQAGVESYVDRFFKHLGRTWARRARIVGIHNYSDVNRERRTGTRRIMSEVREHTSGVNFWWTETGAIVRFARSFPCDEERAADRLKYLFGMARDFEAHVQRIYVYNWTGAGCDARFDAGLTNPDGSVRPGYRKLLAHLAHMKR